MISFFHGVNMNIQRPPSERRLSESLVRKRVCARAKPDQRPNQQKGVGKEQRSGNADKEIKRSQKKRTMKKTNETRLKQ